ncbi:MAG TPA: hypothetical protein VHV49_20020, partial [Pseudonocardiaceae bacterium]|nr:hypothetical protein [Pseudonocardiaceae bacterium]
MTENGSTQRGDAVAHTAPVPGAPLRVVPPETRLATMARLWSRVVARSSFVPEGRSTARAVLANSLRSIVEALTAEPFDPGQGHEIGRTLVASHISSPRALGDSIDLLGGRLLDELGIEDEQAPRRLAALLGRVATG